VYTAPSVKPGSYFTYFDPIDQLPPEGKTRWANPTEHDKMISEALAAARAHVR
jgi:lysine 2,3-aminomutase